MKLKTKLNKFITNTNKIYDNKYSYMNTNYINNATKVIIVCTIHGNFMKTIGNHIFVNVECPQYSSIKIGLMKKIMYYSSSTNHLNFMYVSIQNE